MDIALIHGFSQRPQSWGRIPEGLLSRLPHARVDSLTLPGHADLSHAPTPFESTLATWANWAAGQKKIWVGYSAGARHALGLALTFPELTKALVLIGVTPGIEDPDMRSNRRVADAALATRLRSEGVEKFLRKWVELPIFSGLTQEEADLEGRIKANSANGLAGSLELAGTGSMPNMWGLLKGLKAPCLLVTGSRDDKFTDIAVRMCEKNPSFEHVVIADATHACHLQHPEDFCRVVAGFLERRLSQ